MSLIMVDLDLLRDINNTYGHLAGDVVIVGTSQIIKESIRDGDLPGRFGGEKFAIVLPETNFDQAMGVAERIRGRVAGATFKCPGWATPIRSSVSVGVASYPDNGNDAESLIREADAALYRAKASGRNTVAPASGLVTEPIIQNAPTSAHA